jgi:colicin import membrane protein
LTNIRTNAKKLHFHGFLVKNKPHEALFSLQSAPSEKTRSKEENHVDQAELELQLQVWKDLAISKQMLIRSATDALGLDSECSSAELKEALDVAIRRSLEAESNVKKAQQQARLANDVMAKKLSVHEKALAEAESVGSQALAAQNSAEQQLTLEREAHLKELKKVKASLAEKQKALKDINVALADTPENVLKKLKTLKKQKLDEANSRKRLEGDVRGLRKEKQQLEQRVKTLQETLENSAKLAQQHRELHALSTELKSKLEALVDDAESLPDLPDLPTEILESIENATNSDES